MLDEEEQARVAAKFGVYEHEWSFYAGVLGEPYLLDDCLVYFDGCFLFISCFPLDDPRREVSPDVLRRIVGASAEFERVGAVNVWGRFPLVDAFDVAGGRQLRCVRSHDYDDGEPSVAVDLARFSWRTCARARAARNSARNKGLTWTTRRRQFLTASHMNLIGEWMRTHDVGRPHVAIALSIAAYVRLPHVYVVDVCRGTTLVGFGVLSTPAPGVAALMQTFVERSPGGRVGDAVSAGAIETALEWGAGMLYRGYSPTASVGAFKAKWQATIAGPSYREAFFTSDAALAKEIVDGGFLWEDRVRGAMGKGIAGQ